VIPKRSSTVILLNENKSKGFQVFLLKRSEKSSFMGSNYVYPGGVVDESDSDSSLLPFCHGFTPVKASVELRRCLPEHESMAVFLSCIRELFEEAGILLAYDKEGNMLSFKDQQQIERFTRYRQLLHTRRMTLNEIAKNERISLARDCLRLYAHWITPEARPIRFDTFFFIARNPEGQKAIADQIETTDGLWIRPDVALLENLEGRLVLSPPTLKTLEDLSRFDTVDDIFDSLIDCDVSPILPTLFFTKKESFVLFPWDPDYGKTITTTGEEPIDHGSTSSLSDNTTRIIFRDGRVVPYSKKK